MSSVNAVVAWLGSFALLTLAALVFGSFLLRLFGAATMFVPTVFLLAEANLNTADAGSYLVFVPMAVLGLVMWLAGHRLHHAQHGWWKSPLAGHLWRLPAHAHRRLTAGAPIAANRSVVSPPRRGR